MLDHPNPADNLLQHAVLRTLILLHQTATFLSSHATTMTLLADIAQVAQDRPVLAFALISLTIIVVLAATTSAQKFPKDVPWIGRDDSKSFAVTRATFSSINNVNKWLAEGYQKVRLPLRVFEEYTR
jgi:hypothetical protein